MANPRGRGENPVDPMSEIASSEKELLEVISRIGKQLDAQRRKTDFVEKKAQEKALATFRQDLEKNGTNVTEKMQLDFLKEYEKVKQANALKAIREQANQQKKELIEYYKENSKLAQKERDKENKQLEKELEIAKLLSTIDESTGKQKGFFKQVGDTAAADLRGTLGSFGNAFDSFKKDFGVNLLKGIAGIGDKLSGEINSVISSYAQYQTSINTRLQGLVDDKGNIKNFQTIEKLLTGTIGMSPYIKTSDMLNNLSELVSQGIAFNIEQRAFLETLGENIASTFDVANASLLRIVKLQQQDSSASRLGMEAYLTRYFNEMFQDTQYLSQTFDSVTAALVEATSQMGTQQAVEFEYIVQKWLGSLSAVGMSENTVQAIAEAIGYLGAGNVNALSGSSMQNLLVMAASKAGLDYSSILTRGLNAYNTNTLLNAVVSYMQEIGGGGSNVVKSQYAQTFGVSVSDLTAASNLQIKDLETINKNMMSYSGAVAELGYQLNQIGSRVSLPAQIQNLMSNIKFGVGQGIAQNPLMAGMWSITDLIQSTTGGIAIPAISVFGNMVDLNTTVENLIKTGLVGVSTLSKIGDLFTGLNNANNMSGLVTKDWFGAGTSLEDLQTVTRGKGLSSRAAGMSTSMSTIVGNAAGGEISEQALGKAMAPAEERRQKGASAERGASDIFNYLVYLLDPKISTMTRMLGALAGYNVGLTSSENPIDKNSEYILNYGASVNSVTVGTPAETASSRQYDQLVELNKGISNIHDLLKNGISVTVSNISSLSTIAGGTPY